MKLPYQALFVFAALAATPSARAGIDILAYPETLTYEEVSVATPDQVQQDLDRISPVFDQRGFPSIATDETGKRYRMLDLDEVYGDFDCDQTILAKWNLAPAGTEGARLFGKLVKEGESYLFHDRTPTGTPYVLYLTAVSEKQAIDLVLQAQAALAGQKTSYVPRHPGAARNRFLSRVVEALIPLAMAEDDRPDFMGPAPTGSNQTVRRDSSGEVHVEKATFVAPPVQSWRENARGCSVQRAPAGIDQFGASLRDKVASNTEGNSFLRFSTSCALATGLAVINFIPGVIQDSYDLTVDVAKTAGHLAVPSKADMEKYRQEAAAKGKKVSAFTYLSHPLRMVWKGLKDLTTVPKQFLDLGKKFGKDAKTWTAGKWGDLLCTVLTQIGIGIAGLPYIPKIFALFKQGKTAAQVVTEIKNIENVKQAQYMTQPWRYSNKYGK